jgi:integrase
VDRGDGYQYKRGSTIWNGYSHNGKEYQESTHTKDPCGSGACSNPEEHYAAAHKLLKRRLREIAAHSFVGPQGERIRFEGGAEAIRANYRIRGRRSGRVLDTALKRLGEWFNGDRLVNITSERISAYAAARLDEGFSASTIRYDLAILRRMFNILKESKRLNSNAAPHVTMPEEAPARQGFLAVADFGGLLAALPLELQDPVLFLYLTGWRVGEMRSLEWRDIDFESRAIRLRQENSKNKNGRVIKLSGELFDIIVRAYDRRRADCATVFHIDGRKIGSFRKTWLRACQAVGLNGLLVHDLRRSAIRNMIRSGISENVAMRISGHKTASVFRRYDIVSEDDLADAAERIDQYVNEHRGEQPKVVPLIRQIA